MNAVKGVLQYFGGEAGEALCGIDKDIMSCITEIRIRKNNFIVLVAKNTCLFVDKKGEISEHPDSRCIKTNADYVDRLFLKMCEYSIYSNEEQIKQGFITLQNGARVGICGTAVMNKDRVASVRNITSLNIRIPRRIKGCSDSVLNCLYVNSFPSVIVAGMPASGKTTLLRDMAYQLSNGFNDRYKKVALIDERGELAGKPQTESALETGVNTDVLSSFPKALGIDIATRTLSPEMIICDEISRESEVEAITAAFSSGISFALSVHIGSRADLYRKSIIKKLLETGEFSYIVLLCGVTYTAEIIDAQEVYSEICRNNNSASFNLHGGRGDV
ncbi:MAG: hypothetical protein IJI47_02780 [Eubacterium sp.]|nr:hypothetical protein [Eubacterium sp.]MBR0412477.1 hypothetical protein [Eubacterium sp.]